eukprot:6177245-Pleurochrysis_carterae.AAC.6
MDVVSAVPMWPLHGFQRQRILAWVVWCGAFVRVDVCLERPCVARAGARESTGRLPPRRLRR